MTLHPEMQMVLDMSTAVTSLPWDETTDVDTAREACGPKVPPPFEVELASVDDVEIPNGSHAIPARLYRPVSEPGLGCVIYYHGGGWVVGSVEMYDFFCRQLARATGAAVLSVDYRMAPEHVYPTAAEDAFAALAWVSKEGAKYGIDPDRLAVAGDSAGGNLAAAVSIMARDRGGPALRHQLLLYPVTDADFDNQSYQENAEGYLLTREMMRWFWRHYLGERQPEEAPLAAVLRAPSLRNLPPATVLTAELDPLRDEGAAYARRLQDEQVLTEHVCAPGMLHGFVTLAGLMPSVEAWFAYAATRLRVSLRP